MELKFIKPHKSIQQYKTVNLEDFTILTGYNGSGKSHLLESIKNGSSSIDNVPFSEVILFDYKTFYLENEQTFNNQQINQEKQNAWARLSGTVQNPNIKAQLQVFKNQLGTHNYDAIIQIANGRPFLSLLKRDFNGNDVLFQFYNAYKNSFYNYFNNTHNVKTLPEIQGLKSLAQSIYKTLELLTEDEFYDNYKHISLKNDFLPTQIGKLFIDYWYKYQIFEYRKIKETGTYSKDKFKEEFEKYYGPRPWVLISEILESFQSFNYTINNPESIIIEPDRIKNFTFSLKHKNSGITIPFDHLSSGEKILFSLVLSIYKSKGDKIFPSILLLDEIDASLHPSQIQNLLNVINEIFVNQNAVKVVLVTHSPSTIALAEEKNIYVINNQGENRIEKQTKKTAMNILSEGFITLEEGLQILDEVARKELTIFTEGNNITYIKRAISLIAPEILGKIEIIDKLKDRTGKTQLSNLFDFFSKLPHKNKVLFVYDCDVQTKLQESNETYGFIFEKNLRNSKVIKGIENLFAEDLFKSDFYPAKIKDDGGYQASLDKNKFEQFILDRNNIEDFTNFKPLIEKIKDIL